MRIQNSPKTGFFAAIGRMADRWRYVIIAIWLFMLAGVLIFAPSLSEVVTSDADGILPGKALSAQATREFARYFPDQSAPSQAVVVIETATAAELDAGREAIASLTSYLQNNLDKEITTKILSPADPALRSSLVSADGQAAMLFIGFNVFTDDPRAKAALELVEEQVAVLPAPLQGYVTGNASIIRDYSDLALESVDRTIFITIALVIAMLLIIYRSVIAPLVAFVSIGVSYFITAGIVAWLTDFGLTVVDFTQTFIVVVLFGVGTDYCLFIISRFREYMSQPEACGRRESQRAIAHVGETITSSAGTVVVGMVAMAFASLKLFSTTGPALAIGVVITLLAGLTLTPALLSVIGAHTFWPSHRQQTQAHGGFWRKLAQLVTSHPFLPLSFGLFILVPLAIYGQGYTQSYDMMGDLPESLSTRKGFAVLSQHFGAGDMQPLEVVVPGALDARTPAGLLQVSRITGQIGSLEGVADVRSLAVPQGKINPAAADMLTIPGQIMSMVDGFSSLTRSASDNQDNAGFGLPPTGFVALQSYFTDIGTAYPEIAALPEYSQLRQSMDTLITSSVTLEPRLLIPGQLREMQRLLADVPLLLSGDATGTSPEGSELASQFSLFSAYFDEIVAAYPQISSLDSYRQLEEERTALIQSLGASLAGQYASLAGGASLSLTPDQEAAVKDGLTRLSAALGVLADEVETTIPLAMFIPSDISAFGDAAVSLDGLSAELEGFIESLRVLAGEIHARGIETRYLPIALLAGEAKQSFDTLLAMYTAEEGKVSRYQAILTDQPYSEEAMSAVERLRTFCSTETMCTVSGVTATVYDLREYLHQDTVQSTTLVIAGIVVVLVLLLRSLIAPLYLMATIILSYSATLGISRFVFEGILHQELTWWVPFFMFVLLVALGMDYNIFLMGRVKEETAKADTRTGIEQAVEHTGNIITSAGLIMAGTFAALMAGSIIGLIQLGFAITIGVLLDTFVIRTTIVPAIAVLLGRWNWWPGKGPKNI